MAEYIEREAFKAEIRRLSTHYLNEWDTLGVLAAADRIPAADVRPVVTCSDCKWWTKQEASLQGRCELLQMYPTGAWFCANGKREES